VPVLGEGVMTFERARQILGYDGPLEWMDEDSRETLIHTVVVMSDNGAKPIEGLQRIRWEIETYC
jgi:hypothetical protein